MLTPFPSDTISELGPEQYVDSQAVKQDGPNPSHNETAVPDDLLQPFGYNL